MNKIFSVLLLLTFSFGIISCSNEDPSGANSQLGQVLDQPNSTDDRNSIYLPVITSDNCHLIDNSTIDNSTVDKSSISDNSSIKDSTVKNCSTVTRSIVDNSTIDNSTTCDAYIDNSTIENSTVCYANYSFSIIDRTIRNQIMTEQTDPTLNSVTILSAWGIQNNRLNAGDYVYARANFSESVTVTDDDGIEATSGNNSTPTLTIRVGSNDRTATYHSGSGNDYLWFVYRIQARDNDTNGIRIDNDSLALNSYFIRDASGNYANITHGFADNNTSYAVDNTDPELVDNVTITSATGASPLDPNDVISITATFSESVVVAGGTPELTIQVPAATRIATYETGNETSNLVFKYTIVGADESDGIVIVGDSLDLDGGTIQDLAGNDATINFTTRTTDWEVK